MASPSSYVNQISNKALDTLGAASAIANIPGMPSGIKDALDVLTGGNKGLAPKDNRRDMNNFLSTINRYNGLTRPSYFYIEIAPPKCMKFRASEASDLAFLAESANLPGVALATSEIRRYGYGPTEKKPYAPVFTDTTLSFMVDGQGMIQKFFASWLGSIVHFSQTPSGKSYMTGDNMLDPFEVNFKDQYETDILITTVNDNNDDIITYRFKRAFPIFMGDVALSWADSDSIARLPITFTFYNWSIENLNMNQLRQAGPNSGLLQKALSVGTAIQTLASLRKPTGVADIINTVGNTSRIINSIF